METFDYTAFLMGILTGLPWGTVITALILFIFGRGKNG